MDFNTAALVGMLGGMLMSGANKAIAALKDLIWFFFARKYEIGTGSNAIMNWIYYNSKFKIPIGAKSQITVLPEIGYFYYDNAGLFFTKHGIIYVKTTYVKPEKYNSGRTEQCIYAFRGFSKIHAIIAEIVKGNYSGANTVSRCSVEYFRKKNRGNESVEKRNPFSGIYVEKAAMNKPIICEIDGFSYKRTTPVTDPYFESRDDAWESPKLLHWHNPVISGLDTLVSQFIAGLNKPGSISRLGVLLYGPGSTGKTDGVKCVAAKNRLNILVIDLSAITGEDFESIIEGRLECSDRPIIVLIEDFGHIYKGDVCTIPATDVSQPVTMNRLLSVIDGSELDSPIIWVVTTNEPDDVYEHFGKPLRPYTEEHYAWHDQVTSGGFGKSTRPGRMDVCIHVGGLSAEQVDEVIDIYLPDASAEERASIHAELPEEASPVSATRPTIARVLAEIRNCKSRKLMALVNQ